MSKRARHDGVTPGVARAHFVRESIHTAIARADATVGELPQRLIDFRFEPPRPPRGEVSRLEVGQDVVHRADSKREALWTAAYSPVSASSRGREGVRPKPRSRAAP